MFIVYSMSEDHLYVANEMNRFPIQISNITYLTIPAFGHSSWSSLLRYLYHKNYVPNQYPAKRLWNVENTINISLEKIARLLI